MINFKIQTDKYSSMLKRISLFAILAIFIVSCSNDESKNVPSRKITEYISAVIHGDKVKGDENVIAFGSFGLYGILDKANYKNQPMIGDLISTEMQKLKTVIDISGPVYFLADGPFTKKGNPSRVLLFIPVKDEEKLAKDLEKIRNISEKNNLNLMKFLI